MSELMEEFGFDENDVNEEEGIMLTEVYRKGNLVLYEHEDEDVGSSVSTETVCELFPEYEIDPRKYYLVEKDGEICYEQGLEQ